MKENKMKKTLLLAILGTLACGFTTATAQDAPPQNPPPGGHQMRGPGGPAGGPPAIMAALDANHDGVIDAKEIANASAALATLDKNGEGKLTQDEFAGGRRGGMPQLPKELLEKYDIDKDGQLSETERAALHKDIQDGKVQPPAMGHEPGQGPGQGHRGPGGPRGPQARPTSE